MADPKNRKGLRIRSAVVFCNMSGTRENDILVSYVRVSDLQEPTDCVSYAIETVFPNHTDNAFSKLTNNVSNV